MGADFGKAFLETLADIRDGVTLPAGREPIQARARETYEFTLHGFRDAALVGEFTAPSGKLVSVEGFHTGGDSWELRFVPQETGEYKYVLRGDRRQVYSTDHVRMASWSMVCAGGYFAAAFISTLAHADAWDVLDPKSKHPFVVTDAGAGKQLEFLYEFFSRLPFWRMGPRPERLKGRGLCLAAEGEAYVVYLPHGDRCRVVPDTADVSLTGGGSTRAAAPSSPATSPVP